jgi:hypothetical protein
MRRAVPFLLGIGLVATMNACSGRPPTLQEVADLADRAGAAVWKVDAEGCGWRSIGSAFAIDAHHLVTNHHVIANDSAPLVRSRNGTVQTGRVIGSLTYPDVAVIQVEDPLDSSLSWTEPGSVATSDPLVVIGYPAPKHEFSAAPGQVVGFYGDAREAALTNTPIARGNSGGPGVTPQNTVAGVVTLMRLRDKAKERVAIMFTADAVREKVAGFIDKPKDVLSSCGLGPDPVPSVPKSFDISEAPATAAPVSETAPPTFTPRATEATTPVPTLIGGPTMTPRSTDTPRPACPTGEPTATVDSVDAKEQADQTGWWFVTAVGTVRNEASYPVWIQGIEVTVDGDPPEKRSVHPAKETLRSGEDMEWRFGGSVYSPSGQPTTDSVSVALTWDWSSGNYSWCASG